MEEKSVYISHQSDDKDDEVRIDGKKVKRENMVKEMDKSMTKKREYNYDEDEDMDRFLFDL